MEINYKESVIKTIVSFWVECLIHCSETLTDEQILIFTEELTKTLIQSETFFYLLTECKFMMEIDYNVPNVFYSALKLAEIDSKILPRKTWICLDKENKLGTNENLPVYVRASKGWQGKQYYVEPIIEYIDSSL